MVRQIDIAYKVTESQEEGVGVEEEGADLCRLISGA